MWRRSPSSVFHGVLFTLGVVLVLTLLAWSGLLSERMARRVALLVLLAAVIYTGAAGGIRAGLASAGIAVGYYAVILSLSGTPFRYTRNDFGRVVLVGAALPSVGLVVGWLRERVEQALGRERRARIAAEDARARAEAARDEADAARTDAETAQTRIADILESITDGFVAVDRAWRYTYANRAVEGIAGRPREELIGQDMWEVFSELEGTLFEREYRHAMERREPVHFEAFYPPFGAWFQIHAYPLADGLSMYFRDVTARKRSEQEREALLVREREAKRRIATILESITDAFLALDREWRLTYQNARAREMAAPFMEAEPEAILGRSIWDVNPALRGTRFEEEFRRATAESAPAHFEEYFAPWDVWLEVHAYPSEQGLSVYFRDVTERKRAEEELRETAAAQAFLAEASSILAASLDYEETLRRVARLAVPELADWCVVDLLEDSRIERVEVVHRDPKRQPLADDLRRHPRDLNAPVGIPSAIRTGEPELVSEVTDGWLMAAAGEPEIDRIARELGIRSAMIVPLVARGRTLGALTFAAGESGRRFDRDDLAFARDLADRAAFAVDNARLYREVAVANQAKSDFLTVMSHELRTPLNAIIGFTDLLDAELVGPLTSAQKQQLDRIIGNTRDLLDLIEEVLTFARTEEEREPVRISQVDLVELVRAESERAAPLAREKGLEFHVRMPDRPTPIQTDPGKVRHILRNLLSNAIKFTRAGEIELTVQVQAGAAVLRVRDTGIGIAPENVGRLFEPFWQAERATTRTVGGTGLGLSLARRLARLLGGDIHVESTPGVGSTFTVTMPLDGRGAVGGSSGA